MISINKYGQTLDLSKIVEVNGKKTFSLDGLVVDKSLLIEVPKDTKFSTSLEENDLKIEFKEADGNVFELILKNMANLLAQNDGTQLVKIMQFDDNKVLASIVDITSALEAAAAGPAAGANNGTSDSAANPALINDGLDLQNTTYDNARVANDNLETNLIETALTRVNIAPTIEVNLTSTVDEDGTTTITFVASDINISDLLTSNVTALNGTVTILGNVITYVPNENFNGNDTITLTVNDGTVDVIKTIAVTVNPINDIPTISADSKTVVEDTAALLTTSGTITVVDVDNNESFVVAQINTSGLYGTFNIDENGEWTYLADNIQTVIQALSVTETLIETFIVTSKDGTTTNNVTVTIQGTNDIPTISNYIETINVEENVLTGSISLEDVNANDIDSTDELEFVALTNAAVTVVSSDTDIGAITVSMNSLGEYILSGAGIEKLAEGESATVTFQVQVKDDSGTDINISSASIITLTIVGSNDAPTVKVEPTLVLSEDSFAELFGTANAYKIVTEEEMYALLNVNDVDVNDKISISLVSDSSNFTSLNAGVTNDNSGVIKVTSQIIIDYELVGAKEGDFLIFSAGFDGLGNSENATVTFDVVVTDGIVNIPSTLSVTVNGTNDAPTVKVEPTLVLSEDSFAELSGLANAYKLVTEEEMYALLNVNDVDVNDKISISLVSDSSNFTSLNAGVTNDNSGVIKVTSQIIIDYELVGAKEGDFLIFSAGFDGLGNSENATVTFDVVVTDGIVNIPSTLSVTVNGTNDAPTVKVEPTLVLSEDSFAELSGLANAYKLVTEEEMYALLNVNDVDVNDKISISLVSDSSNFTSLNAGVTNDNSGVIKVTSQIIIDYELVGAKEGDFLIFSAGFDGLGNSENATVTFDVVVTDGIVNTPSTLSVTVNGTNDAPTVKVEPTLVLSEDSFAELSGLANAYKLVTEEEMYALLNVNDVDVNDKISISLVSDSSNFTSLNAGVTNDNSGVIKVTSQIIIDYELVGAKEGDFLIFSAGFDGLGNSENATVTFDVVVTDGIVNIPSTLSVTVNGTNDAPTVKVEPTLVLSEDSFAELFGTANAYKIVTEEEMYALLNVNDVDVNDKISISLVSDSSNFTSLNAGVTNDNSGVIKVTSQIIIDYELVGAKEGDFLIFSAGFDGLGNSENATVTFDVVVTDGIVNIPSTLSVTVNGTNDAPTVKVEPTLVLSEDSFAELFGTANAYKLVTEEEMYALLNVNDVDVNDKISISLVSDSSNFTSLNAGVTNDNSGVIKVTSQIIIDYELVGAKEGDFLIFSAGFDGLGNSENATVTFDVVVTDGIVNTPSTLSVTVNGTNDAPTVKVEPTLVLSEDSFAELFGTANAYKIVTEEEMYALLNVNDVDVNDKISISLVSDSSNFTSLNAGVTNENSGVIKVTKQMVDDNDVPGAKEGDFLIFSAGFDGLGNSENATVTFDVVVTDGIVNIPSTLSVTVNGTNDAPTVKVEPTLVLSEDSFAELSGLANAYKLVTEEEMYALLNVNDVDVNDKISISLVSDSSNFTSLNAGVTNDNSGVIKVTSQIIIDYELVGAKEGDFLIFSAGFDGLGNSENATVTFDVVVTDGIVNTPSTLSVTVNGTNDAPTVKVAPTLVLSEDSFAELSGTANAYKLVTEEEMYALLNVNDVDVNDKISISLVSDSSNFTSLNAGVTNDNSGVIKVTKQMVDDNDVPGAKEGDFLIFSAGFDGLGNSENATVTFDVVVTDGIVNTPSTLSVTVNGTNDAPTVKVEPTLVLSEDSFAELFGTANAYKLVTEEEMYALLNVNDVDVNDKISISLVSDSSNFTSLNAGVTNDNSGVIKVTSQIIIDYELVGAKEGDFLIFSAGFDGLGNSENATVTFDVVVTDGIVNTPSTLSVTVNGTNDAPTVKVEPTLVLSEDSFAELSGLANAYKLVTEEEMYALLNVNDVDVNDKISISLVSDSSNFTSLNAGVTNDNSGVIKVTSQIIIDYELVGAKEGDFLIFSAGFDGLGNSENATVTFDVVVTDGIVNIPSTLSVTVNGTNDAPTVKVEPTLVLSEDSFAELSGLANAYKLVTEEEMYALLNVNDVDVNDKISISLVSDSSNFTSLNVGVNNDNSGVIKVTKQMVDDNDVPGAKEGDFLIFSAGFDGLGNSENATVTFDVVVTDGIVNTPSTLSVTVNGTNDAPTVKVAPTLVLSEIDFAELFGTANAYKLVTEEEMYALLNVNDVDVNDKISISLVSDSSNFTSLNVGVNNDNSGVIKVTSQIIIDYELVGAKEGDFLIFSAGFDGLGNSENATVTFDVVVTDGIVNTPSTLSVTVNGTNDAPTVKVAPTLVLSEIDFAELFGTANAYKLVTEEEMYALLNVNDVDVNDKISISLVSDSSNFTSLNVGVNNDNSGVIKVTKQMVDDNDVPGAKEGDFLIFSAGFDGLGNSENATVTFDVVVTDGIVNTPSTLSVTVNGTNDAPTVKATTEVDGTYVNTAIPTTYDSSIIVANINATDTDINDTLVYSIVVNSLDDSQYLSIDSITGVVTFIDETAYNTANISALNFQVKVLDLNAAEAVYSIQSGTGIDGYIVNMTVFSDFDNDQTLDSTEASDQTNSQGEFTLSGTDLSGTIVGYGGTDISTGLNFEGLYKAPAGSIVLNPITTLLVNLMNEGNTLEEAKTIIKDDFGITASVDLQADPIGQALSSTATSEQQTDYIALQMLSTKIDNTVGQIASAINGANITDERNAFDVVSQELAKLLNSGSVDLDNATFIDTLITNSLIVLNGALNTNIQLDLVDVILNINTSVSQAITTSTTPLESLESLAKVQIAAEEIENAFEAGVIVEDTSAVVISSLSENFTVKVDAAEVGLISKEQILNNAPVASISSTISSNENVTYVGQLVASDEDVNDTLTYSYDNSSVSMTLSVIGLNNLDSLVALNNPLAIQALTELKTVGLTFVNTGNVLALTTLSSSTIVAAKIAVSTLQDFLDSNSGLKNDIVALKDFISANKASIIAHTALVAQDIVLLETLLTPSNITALGNLFNTLETFVSDPVAQAIVKNILADNVVSPTELALLAPIAPQIQLLRTEIVTLLASNPAIIGLLDIPTIISKLQEVVDVDTVKGEITATVEVPSTIAEMMISLDENTGEYTVTNPYLAALPESTQVEVNFDYTVTDSLGATDSSTASMLITTANVNEMNVSINDNNVLMIDESQNIDMASLLSNATSNLNVADIDSIDLSNSEHILSNITIADFEEMVSDDSSNTLSITGENDDVVKLDLSIWTKNEADTDINSVVDNMDDNFIAYTTTGTHNQVLTLLIDKDIIVQDI